MSDFLNLSELTPLVKKDIKVYPHYNDILVLCHNHILYMAKLGCTMCSYCIPLSYKTTLILNPDKLADFLLYHLKNNGFTVIYKDESNILVISWQSINMDLYIIHRNNAKISKYPVLNIDALQYKPPDMKEFTLILQKCHSKIKKIAATGQTSCVFNIPLSYKPEKLIQFLLNKLSDNGLFVRYDVSLNNIYISWHDNDINLNNYIQCFDRNVPVKQTVPSIPGISKYSTK